MFLRQMDRIFINACYFLICSSLFLRRTAFIRQIIVQVHVTLITVKSSWLAIIKRRLLPRDLNELSAIRSAFRHVVAGDLVKNLHLVLPLLLGEAHLLKQLQVGRHVLRSDRFTLLLQ